MCKFVNGIKRDTLYWLTIVITLFSSYWQNNIGCTTHTRALVKTFNISLSAWFKILRRQVTLILLLALFRKLFNQSIMMVRPVKLDHAYHIYWTSLMQGIKFKSRNANMSKLKNDMYLNILCFVWKMYNYNVKRIYLNMYNSTTLKEPANDILHFSGIIGKTPLTKYNFLIYLYPPFPIFTPCI